MMPLLSCLLKINQLMWRLHGHFKEAPTVYHICNHKIPSEINRTKPVFGYYNSPFNLQFQKNGLLLRMVLSFESVYEIIKSDRSNECYRILFSCGTVYCAVV